MKIARCEIIRKLRTDRRMLSVTFDDGPHPVYTPKIMDLLDNRNARGTFFMTGRNIESNPELVKEASARGHLIANHTYSHPHALFCSADRLRNEINRTKNMIEDITGKTNRFFRPPYGFITPRMLSICRELELSIVLWNANGRDFRKNGAAAIVRRLRNGIKPGSILLLHDCKYSDNGADYSKSIEALGIILDNIDDRGLKPVTVEELIT